MEIELSEYQAVVLDKAIDIFKTRGLYGNVLIEDAYVLQKQLAEWISINTNPTGTSSNFNAVKADSILAFNTAIQFQAAPVISNIGAVGSAIGSTQAAPVADTLVGEKTVGGTTTATERTIGTTQLIG